MTFLPKVATIPRIKEAYLSGIVKYILLETKRAKRGEIQRKIICIGGSPELIQNIYHRILSVAGKNKISISSLDSSPDFFDNNSKTKVYLYKTSQINSGDDRWIAENHPGLVIILEDSRQFTGNYNEKFMIHSG